MMPPDNSVQKLSQQSSCTTDDEERLCQSCGLCCTGVMFSEVPLHETDDCELLQNLGIDIQLHDGKKSFSLPCQHHDESSCKIYADRPGVCVGFRCCLLKDLHTGKIDLQQAEQYIHTVSLAHDRLKREIAELAPNLAGSNIFKIRHYVANHPSEQLKPIGFYAFVLARYIRQHFRPEKKQQQQSNNESAA
ncbi:MAG: hypothetical protein GY799_02305 [Desulfobulbaceae bacterium]|nr:hypothetical protein [Desulfobulbaceae bacterium]